MRIQMMTASEQFPNSPDQHRATTNVAGTHRLSPLALLEISHLDD